MHVFTCNTPTVIPSSSPQVAAIVYYAAFQRQRSSRAFFHGVLQLGLEQDRCDGLLQLLLPPTIASEVKSQKSARDLLEPGFDEAGGVWDDSAHGISSLGEDRYAESFAEASVLFAEGE